MQEAAEVQLVRLARTFVDSRLLVGVRAQEQGMHAADPGCTSGSVDVSSHL